MNIDFSAQKQLSDLVEVAKNRALPVPERMEALFQLAAVDFAYKRYAEADTKYAQLFDYYKGKDKVHQVMCLQGSGDIATQQKNSTLALKRYLSGIAIAVEEELPLVMLPLFKGAAEAYLALGNYQLAEGYFDHAVTIAGKLSNVNTQADTLEQRGISQLNQRLGQKALESFDACWKLCERVGYEQRWQSALERLQQLYQQASMYQEAINVENRLKKGFPLAPAETESTKEYV